MHNILVFTVAIVLAASIIVAWIEGEAAAVKREVEPRAYWAMLALGVGSLGALLVFGMAE